jgi:hypothetical protein
MSGSGGEAPRRAFGHVAKKPASKIPGTDRGQFSKVPEGPSVGMSAKGPKVRTPSGGGALAQKAREGRLRGVKI